MSNGYIKNTKPLQKIFAYSNGNCRRIRKPVFSWDGVVTRSACKTLPYLLGKAVVSGSSIITLTEKTIFIWWRSGRKRSWRIFVMKRSSKSLKSMIFKHSPNLGFQEWIFEAEASAYKKFSKAPTSHWANIRLSEDIKVITIEGGQVTTITLLSLLSITDSVHLSSQFWDRLPSTKRRKKAYPWRMIAKFSEEF